MRIRDEALKLAGQGLPVFPCHNRPDDPDRDKTPWIYNGFLGATTDVQQIRRWWCQPWMARGTLIGVATGGVSGIGSSMST